jgi:IclR family transcriptional regulator, pca regulon regulatory protein
VRAADDRAFIMSLARGLAALLAFTEKRRHLSMAEISHRTGISRAAVGRSLHTLCELGYVAVDESRLYYLRPKVMAFANAYISGNPLLALAQPVLDRLSEDLGQSCSLAIGDGDEIVYVARGTSSRIISVALNVGGRIPLYCSATGLVLLAHSSPAQVADYLHRVALVRFTRNTITTADALRAFLAKVRQDGYVIADEHWRPGLCTMAVPVRDEAGAVVAGMNIIVKTGSMTYEQMEKRLLARLRAAADALGGMLNASADAGARCTVRPPKRRQSTR